MQWNPELLSNRLKLLIDARGEAAITVSLKAGLSRGQVSDLINLTITRPQIDSIFKLAAYFKVSPAYLLGLQSLDSEETLEDIQDVFEVYYRVLQEDWPAITPQAAAEGFIFVLTNQLIHKQQPDFKAVNTFLRGYMAANAS